MTVYFIGAGPGAADLITLRGQRLIETCPICLYAGSLVPQEIVSTAPEDAKIMDTASMTLDQIVEEFRIAHASGLNVARVHSGDPSIYGAIGEQMRRLEDLDIPYEVVPGVPAFAAAAAALKTELTLPDVSQSVILTRTAMKSSVMPPGEELENLAKTRATLAIHLSIRNIKAVVTALSPAYGDDCPVAVVYRVTWPDEKILRSTLSAIATEVRAAKLTRTALILVGRALDPQSGSESRLYAADHVHLFRHQKSG
tara:strand:- start:412 stop:1176 length:765 start_codon:yes stop_codon:yes gene_type:complete